MDLREAKEAFDEFREKIEIYPGYEEFDFSEFDQKRYLYGVKMTFIILARALGVTTDLIPAGSNDFYSLEDLSSEVVEIVSNALRKYGWNVEEVDIPTSDYDEDTQEEMWEEMRKVVKCGNTVSSYNDQAVQAFWIRSQPYCHSLQPCPFHTSVPCKAASVH